MVTQINPFQQQVWRSVEALQIGLGGESVVLENLSPSQQRFVATLVASIADSQVVALARQLKLDLGSAQELIATLAPVLLKSPMAEPTADDHGNANLVRATLKLNTDGFELLAIRATKRVFVNQLDRAGAELATALARVGVGTLLTGDRGRVAGFDLDHYLRALDNCARVAALGYQLKEFGLKTKVSSLDKKPIDLAVLVSQQYLPSVEYAPLMNRQVPHIAVVFDQAGVTVSPLIQPGETPCLYCLEQSRIEKDPAWPVIASQLSTSSVRFDDSISRSFASAVIAQAASNWFDSACASTQGFKLDSRTGEITTFDIAPSEFCDCLLALRLEQVDKPRALAS